MLSSWHWCCSVSIGGDVAIRTIGILTSLVGTTIGAWWLVNQRRLRKAAALPPARDHETVVFDTIPSTVDIDAIL
jgi:hypothetical protein